MAKTQKSFFVLILPALAVFLIIAGLGVYLFWRSSDQVTHLIQENHRATATLAAMQIQPAAIESILHNDDHHNTVYLEVVQQLHHIRQAIPNARFAYIFRRTSDPNVLAFVADADAALSKIQLDRDMSGVVDADEAPALPGDRYDISEDPILAGPAFNAPVVSDVYKDQWGQLISSYAPIIDNSGTVIATLGIDMQADTYGTLRTSAFPPLALFGTVALAILSAVLMAVVLWRRRAAAQREIETERLALIRLALFQFATPLSTLRWWMDILKEQEPPNLNEDRADAYQNVDQAMHKMFSMLEHFQRVSDIKLRPEERTLRCDLEAAIQLSLKQEGKRIAYRKQHIEIIGNPRVQIQGSLRIVSGVMAELIHNACSYSEDGTLITLHIAENHAHQVECSIIDRGMGISTRDMPHVFEQFWRSDTAKKRRASGFGIGLTSVRSIVEDLGGKVRVESQLGQGTTVHCTFVKAE
jgi:signal transduction histidine kinase